VTEPEELPDADLLRYSRHLLLDDIGVEGQRSILKSRALIIGAGGLGSPAAMYLACSGVGSITIVDDDTVDLTNLQRQIMHNTASIGQAKVLSAQRTLRELNPTVQVQALQTRADAQLLQSLVIQADVVLDCSDNFQTRQAINTACVQQRVPLVSGAAIGMDGQIAVYDPREADAPCYACVFAPDAPPEEARCATMGVLAPLVGVIGAMQALEALKLLSHTGTSLSGYLLMLDARSMEWTRLRVQKKPACVVCGTKH
jgi:molybdopterin/thiamine biosynthesis adenylyltransferase